VSCLKNNIKIYIKIYIKTAATCFGAVTPSSGSALFEHAKVTVVKIVNYNTSVCGDVAAYISGSLLVCVRCTVRKQITSEERNVLRLCEVYPGI